MGAPEISAYLSHPAIAGHVAASTKKQEPKRRHFYFPAVYDTFQAFLLIPESLP